jgi:hypothetical protein
MPCPFPGMDPYLEFQPFWGDFAPTLLTHPPTRIVSLGN